MMKGENIIEIEKDKKNNVKDFTTLKKSEVTKDFVENNQGSLKEFFNTKAKESIGSKEYDETEFLRYFFDSMIRKRTHLPMIF